MLQGCETAICWLFVGCASEASCWMFHHCVACFFLVGYISGVLTRIQHGAVGGWTALQSKLRLATAHHLPSSFWKRKSDFNLQVRNVVLFRAPRCWSALRVRCWQD